MSTLNNMQLPDIKKKHGLTDFVETGTFEGQGIDYAISVGFKSYWSCDIVERWASEARIYYLDRPEVHIFHGNSLDFLSAHVPADLGPTFYWLDAHHPWEYDQNIEENEQNKFPVLLELEILKKRPGIGRDVIMIDDLIVIQGSPRWHQGEVGEYHQVRSVDWETLLHFMDDTHEPIVNLGMEGLLTFVPKAK